MGIPSLKKIKERLGVEGREATVIRQAMEWAEGADPKPTLERYYEDEVYSVGQGLYGSLDYYRRPWERIHPAMIIIDNALGNFGVEYIESNQDTYHSAEGLDYSNTGYTDGATVIYDHGTGRWHIGDWGYFVETFEERFGESGGGGWYNNPDAEATELALFIENDFGLYRQMVVPVQKNLINKMAAGTYDHDKAVKAWFNVATEGAKRYHKEHGTPGVPWHQIFPVAVRRDVAERMADYFEEEAALGNFDHLLYKKYRTKPRSNPS